LDNPENAVPPCTVIRLRKKKELVAGILDGAVLRTSGYQPGSNDVAVAAEVAQRFGLRTGDAVRGAGSPLDEVNSVNGLQPVVPRPDFHRLAAEEPRRPLQIDRFEVLKGERALLPLPWANLSLSGVHGVHLMLVVVDAPAEVRESLPGGAAELVFSGSDRSQAEQRGVVALVIERAKRLVELNHDVVILFDSVSRFGRFDPDAAHLARQLLSTARSIKDGGSLTVVGGYDGEVPPILDDLGCVLLNHG
jgi:transcription termination factor Rho